MKRLTILSLFVLYVIVAGVSVFLHWYAATHAHALKDWYLERYPRRHELIHAAIADLFLPAIVLGFGAGWLTAVKSQLELALHCLWLALGVVALFDFYAVLIPTHESEMWDSDSVWVRVLMLAPAYFKAALICMFFASIGRNVMRQVKRLKPDVG